MDSAVVTQSIKIPPTRSRRVFFLSTFLRATKILSNTHSQHPAAAGEEWILLNAVLLFVSLRPDCECRLSSVWQETSPQKGIASAGVIGTTSPLCAPWRAPTLSEINPYDAPLVMVMNLKKEERG